MFGGLINFLKRQSLSSELGRAHQQSFQATKVPDAAVMHEKPFSDKELTSVFKEKKVPMKVKVFKRHG